MITNAEKLICCEERGAITGNRTTQGASGDLLREGQAKGARGIGVSVKGIGIESRISQIV
jgi:hypothetical protein